MATIDEALGIALDHHMAGRLAEAEALYARILDAAPDHAPALHLAGVLACQTGRAHGGAGLFARAAREAPGVAAYRLDLAKALAGLEAWADAVTALRALVALEPASADGWILLGVAAVHAPGAGLNGAITALEHADRLVPEREEAWGRLALLLQQRAEASLSAGRRDEAMADARRAAAWRPLNAELRFVMATVHLDSGRAETAVAGYRDALALTPGDPATLHNLGLALTRSRRAEEALPLQRRAARLDPVHTAVREALLAALQTRDPAEALAWSCEILAIKRRAADALPSPPPLSPAPRDAAGRTRNVVAFSLWGTRAIYTQGARANARDVPQRYPGWTCRIYHDDSVPPPLRAELAGLGAELVEMPAGSGPAQGLFWRFLAADDPTVDRFVCRDLDSRILGRETAAVGAWIASGLPFHVMRDHMRHTDLILAGMWGGRAGVLPPIAPAIAGAARRDADRWQDQRFLADWLWPRIRAHALVHDSVHPGAGQPFPPSQGDPPSAHVGAKVLRFDGSAGPDGAVIKGT